MKHLIALSGLLALPLSGCVQKAPACTSTVECDGGQACVESECRPVECLSSEDCSINHFCDKAYKCQEGCSSAADCLAGEECSGGECVSYGCRDTQLDCNYGEFCDTTTGQCYEAEANYCKSCDATTTSSCSSGQGYCLAEAVPGNCASDRDCDPGYSCDNFGGSAGKLCHLDYCALSCDPDDESPCPRGFDCVDIEGNGKHYCSGSCIWLTDNGYNP